MDVVCRSLSLNRVEQVFFASALQATFSIRSHFGKVQPEKRLPLRCLRLRLQCYICLYNFLVGLASRRFSRIEYRAAYGKESAAHACQGRDLIHGLPAGAGRKDTLETVSP